MGPPGAERVASRAWGWLFLALAVAVVAGGALLVAHWPGPADTVEVFLPTPTATPSVLRVHVAGAVARPGVYDLRPGDRVEDAITAAGGTVEGADPHALNLAAPLRDGQKIVVPLEGESSSPAGLVAINSAPVAELETLPLIGEGRARDIVSYREEHGPFQRVEDLLLVPGIGPGTLERIRDLITLD